MTRLLLPILALFVVSAIAQAEPLDDPIKSADHRLKHKTNVPNFEGQEFELAVRERIPVKPNGEAILCLHGLSVPGTCVYDLPHRDYSWMRYLAERGYRVYAVDMTGYGRSTRPPPMNDPHNLSGSDRTAVKVIGNDRPYPFTMTCADSDLHDIDTAVDWVRKQAGVERVHLIGCSLGGARTMVYAAHHPEKVGRLVVQGWGIGIPMDLKPAKLPDSGVPVTITTERGFKLKWELMARRKGQVEAGLPDAVWKSMLASDPEGAKWGPGVMRSPGLSLYGWNSKVWAGIKSPILLIHGEYDPIDPPGKALFEKLSIAEKVNLTYDGTSHMPYWETGHEHLFSASAEWIAKATADGHATGEAIVSVEGKFKWK